MSSQNTEIVEIISTKYTRMEIPHPRLNNDDKAMEGPTSCQYYCKSIVVTGNTSK